MEKPRITSLTNPLVKQARSLHSRKGRLDSGLFLVEGIHHVGEVIEAGWEVESIIYAPEMLTSAFANDLVSRLADKAQPVSTAVMESLADRDNPQGILVLVHQQTSPIADLNSPKRSIALVAPQDPGNLGTILRTMDAAGVDALFLLDGGVELFHPTVIRSSMGSLFWKPVIQISFDEFLKWARSGGYQLIGSSARADVDYQTIVPQVPWVLILGNEQKGLSSDQFSACDVNISLPMQGRVSSLNLAVAAGVLLYALNKS
jgi:TrmH family RNA methyltransferase